MSADELKIELLLLAKMISQSQDHESQLQQIVKIIDKINQLQTQ